MMSDIGCSPGASCPTTCMWSPGSSRVTDSRSFCTHGSRLPPTNGKTLNDTGKFCQPEYSDHLLRSEAEFEHALRYVAANPMRAGWKDWPWVWVRGRDALATAGGTPA